jgi:Spy/CpxP family protein refolding chaperone
LVAGLALGSLLVGTATSSAQDQAPKKKGRMTVEQRMERMTTELKLTDEQKPKVEAVLKDTDKKTQEIRSSTTDRDERAEKMKPVMEEETKKLKDILTPDQFEKYKKMQEQMRNRMRGGPGGPGGPPPGGEKKSQ